MARTIELNRQDASAGNLVLVNPHFPLRSEPDARYLVEALPAHPGAKLDQEAALYLRRLVGAAGLERGVVPVSGCRTRAEQQRIWDATLAERGADYTRTYVARPGHSEHETGLAIDLAFARGPIDLVTPFLPRTGAFRKLRRYAERYGFVERYLAGKEQVTGIGAEPWHFRYVGFPHAAVMVREGMVLEEYIAFLKRATGPGRPYTHRAEVDYAHPYSGLSGDVCIDVVYLATDIAQSLAIEIPDRCSWKLSGTNEGGVVLTLWRPCGPSPLAGRSAWRHVACCA